MAFKFCPECGFKFDKEYKFCPECGYKLDGTAGSSKPEPLFDFSDDTAQYADQKLGGFDEQLNKASAPKRTKQFEPIYDEDDLRWAERTTLNDLHKNDKKMYAAKKLSYSQREKEENKLADQFNEYFNSYVELAPENGITIERNVPPEYFGADPNCKPVHFLFKKYGRDALALVITKYTCSHPAVTDVEKACWKNMKYLKLFIGAPNTEHYVMRNVLELLNIIPRVY